MSMITALTDLSGSYPNLGPGAYLDGICKN